MSVGRAEGWIAALLRGDDGLQFPAEAPRDADVAVAEARRQGVVSLVYALLATSYDSAMLPPGWREAFAAAARTQATQSLALLSECRLVSTTLAAAGIPVIWLKGMSVAQWLYPTPGHRDVADADLLFVSYEETMRAAAVLAAVGYTLPNPHVAGHLVVNELLAVSRTGRELDLHWALGNGPLFARRFGWDELYAEAIALPGLGEGALGLSPVHAFLHAAMHRVANQLVGQGDRLRWLYDLHLMALRLDTAEWQRVVTLAIDRGLADTCHLTLERVKAVLATPVPTDVVRDLARAASSEPIQCRRLGAWHYRQWSDWRTLPTLGQRLQWTRQVLIPDMAHLQVRYGGDGAGPVRIVARRLLDGWRRVRRYTWRARRQP